MTLEASRNANKDPDSAWAESLREVMRQVVENLPDHATLGELIDAAKSNSAMAPVLEIFTVHELIELAKKRPKPVKNGKSRRGEVQYDAEGNPVMDLEDGPKVIRRRADVPDGDARVLRCLLDRGPQRETDLANATGLTADQLRIILRHLRTKGYVHIEGSGAKRRLKITRHGSGFLRAGSA
jgi:predicted transcriptional regulator